MVIGYITKEEIEENRRKKMFRSFKKFTLKNTVKVIKQRKVVSSFCATDA